jgi:hypothetical protein
MSEKINKEALKIIKDLASVRVYNSCGVFQGVMIRDNKKAYKLTLKARKLISKLEKLEAR